MERLEKIESEIKSVLKCFERVYDNTCGEMYSEYLKGYIDALCACLETVENAKTL